MLYHPFTFDDDDALKIAGTLTLDPVPPSPVAGGTQYRTGRIQVEAGHSVDLVLVHSPATSGFMYLWSATPQPALFQLLGLPAHLVPARRMPLPGQLLLGPARTELTGQAVSDALLSPQLAATIKSRNQDDLVVLPVLREGGKYRIGDGLLSHYGYYCDEALVDSHHVTDEGVARYRRRVETTILKDKDITETQRAEKRVALIGDSIASGIVMLGVFDIVGRRFPNIRQLEVISPFATLRGLARLAHFSRPELQIRVHTFETILNALPPEFYYSAHFAMPEFHIRPDLEESYRRWWGRDARGECIADTACAGYGWAEAFFNPRKQIAMINQQLRLRHNLEIADVVRRNLG